MTQSPPRQDLQSPEEISSFSILPLISMQVWGFIFLDLLLGVGLFNLKPKVSLLITQAPFSLRFWSVVFIFTGLLKTYALLKKKSHALHWLLLVSIFVRLSWLMALIMRLDVGGTLFTAAIWGILTYIELAIYIYYFTDKKTNI